MVREGHGRGIGAGAGCPRADAARRPRRSADEADQSGEDEGAAVVEHDPEKWVPVVGKDHAQSQGRRRERNEMKRWLPLVVLGAALASSAQAQSLTKLRVAYD